MIEWRFHHPYRSEQLCFSPSIPLSLPAFKRHSDGRQAAAFEDAVTSDREDKWSGWIKVPSSVIFVVALAVAALWSLEAEFTRVVFKIKVLLDEVWVLLNKMVKFIICDLCCVRSAKC